MTRVGLSVTRERAFTCFSPCRGRAACEAFTFPPCLSPPPSVPLPAWTAVSGCPAVLAAQVQRPRILHSATGGEPGAQRCRCQRDCALTLGLCTSSGLKTQTEAIRTVGLAQTEQGDCLWAKFHSGGGKQCGPFFPR